MRFLFILSFIALGFAAQAQKGVFYSGLAPYLSIKHSLTEKTRLVFKAESLNGLVYDNADIATEWDHFHDQTDLQGFLSYKLSPFLEIAGGYQYRIEGDGRNNNRTIQQISILQRDRGIRMVHRIRTDQTFYSNRDMKLRLRYRFGAELPLEGLSIDPGEYFLVFTGEPIYSLQSSKSGLENRLTTSIGYNLNSTNKLRAGLDYRIDKLLENELRQRLWLMLGWHISL